MSVLLICLLGSIELGYSQTSKNGELFFPSLSSDKKVEVNDKMNDLNKEV